MDKTLQALLLALAPVIAEYGPEFTHGIVDLAHGNPQAPGQSDAEWIAATNLKITAKLDDADKKADSVIADQN